MCSMEPCTEYSGQQGWPASSGEVEGFWEGHRGSRMRPQERDEHRPRGGSLGESGWLGVAALLQTGLQGGS